MNTWIDRQYEKPRRIEEEGFSPSGMLAPFHDALVPGIRGLGERGFSTALGNFALYREVGAEYTERLDDLRAAVAGRPV